MRLTLLRIAAVVLAASWFVFPGFGIPDLLVTWDPDWPVVLEAGWGLFSTVLVGAAFLAVAIRPGQCAAALAQLAVATVSLVVGALAGDEPAVLPLAALLAAETVAVAVVARTLPDRPPLRAAAGPLSLPVLVLAVAGAGPWTAYAVTSWRANRADLPVDVSIGIDHAAVQGALALALVLLALVAAVWPGGRRFLGVCAGVVAVYLGLVSLGRPGTLAELGTGWSVAAGAWGCCLVGVALLAPRRGAASEPAGGELAEAEPPR